MAEKTAAAKPTPYIASFGLSAEERVDFVMTAAGLAQYNAEFYVLDDRGGTSSMLIVAPMGFPSFLAKSLSARFEPMPPKGSGYYPPVY